MAKNCCFLYIYIKLKITERRMRKGQNTVGKCFFENALCYSGQVQFCDLWCIPSDETFIIAAGLARPGWATALGWSQADQQFCFFILLPLPASIQMRENQKPVRMLFLTICSIHPFCWQSSNLIQNPAPQHHPVLAETHLHDIYTQICARTFTRTHVHVCTQALKYEHAHTA